MRDDFILSWAAEVQKMGIFWKTVINTKQIYKTYSAKRSRPADFTGSQLLWAVMVISMLFTPSALLVGHVSKTNSTSKFSKQVKKHAFKYTQALSFYPWWTFYRVFAKLLKSTTSKMTTELIPHPSRQIIYKHHKAGISVRAAIRKVLFFKANVKKMNRVHKRDM